MSKFLETYLNNLGIEDFSLILEENALRKKEEIRKIAKALPANQKAEVIKQAIEILNKLRELKKVDGFSKVIDKLEPIKAEKPQNKENENQDAEEKKPTEKETPSEEAPTEEQEEQAWSLNRYFVRG